VDYFSKALLKNKLWSRVVTYTGVDLSAQAIEIGEKNVRQAASPDTQVSFVVDEMLNFVKKMPPASYDLVFSSLAVHHLQDTEKEQLVHEIHRVLKTNGVLLLIDIFLDEEEDRLDFMREIDHHIRQDWVKLSSEQTESIVHHMYNFDFPAKLSVYKHWASSNPHYTDVKCLENIRFYKTVVFEVE
jgi:tRNA (cmo5U34)-methyltransferase